MPPPSSSVSGPASTARRLSRFGGGWRTLPSTAMPLGIPVLNGESLICAAPPPTPRTPSETLAPPWRMHDSSAPIPAAAAEASPLASPCAARRRSSAIGGLSPPVSFTAMFSNCARRPRPYRNDRRATWGFAGWPFQYSFRTHRAGARGATAETEWISLRPGRDASSRHRRCRALGSGGSGCPGE